MYGKTQAGGGEKPNENIISKIMAVPAIKTFLDAELLKHEADVLKTRSGLCTQIKRIGDDYQKKLHIKQGAIATAKSKFELAEAAYKNAYAEYVNAGLEQRNFVTRFEQQKLDIERLLIETADERIDAAISLFRNILSKSLESDSIEVKQSVCAYDVARREIYKAEWNRPAILEKRAYLRSAIDTLSAMKYSDPAFDDAAVQALIDAIPSAKTFTEVNYAF
jgi:hypothetical protein